MCDVRNPDSTPHATNTRAKLVELLTPDVVAEKPMYGFEQVRSLASIHACGAIVHHPVALRPEEAGMSHFLAIAVSRPSSPI